MYLILSIFQITYLLTYRSRLTDIKKIFNFIWTTTCAQRTFLNIEPKISCHY